MKILDLKFSGFGPFLHEQHIPFSELNPKGLLLIEGETGIGKTTLFDAIMYALYGSASGDDRKDAKGLRSDFAEPNIETRVELTFEANNGQIYKVVRTPEYLRPAKKGNGLTTQAATAELTMPDGRIISKSSEVDRIIRDEILFISRDQFKNIALLAQGEFSRLITANSKDRGEILEHIFGKEIYAKFQDKLTAKAKALSTEMERVKSSLDTLIKSIPDGASIPGFDEALGDSSNTNILLSNLEELVTRLSIELKELKDNRDALDLTRGDAKSKYDSLAKDNKTIAKYNEAVKSLEILNGQKEHIDGLKNLIIKCEEAIETMPFVEAVVNNLKDSQIAYAKIKETEEALAKLEVEKKWLEDNKESFEKSKEERDNLLKTLQILDEIKKEFIILSNKNKRYKACDDEFQRELGAFNKEQESYNLIQLGFFASASANLARQLKEGVRCPVCGSIEHPDPAKSVDVVSEADYKKAEDKLNKKRKALESLRGDLIVAGQDVESSKDLIRKKYRQVGVAFEDEVDSNAANYLYEKYSSRKKELEDNINEYSRRETSFTKNYSSNKSNLDNAKANAKKFDELYDKAREAAHKKFTSNKFIHNTYELNDFTDVYEFETLPMVKANAQKEVKNHETKLTEVNTIIDNTPDNLKVASIIDETNAKELLNKVNTEFNEVDAKFNALDHKINDLNKSKVAILEKFELSKEIIKKYQSINELAKTANGANKLKLSFKMYILADYFDKIIDQANKRLNVIARGRYQLARRKTTGSGQGYQGLELDVFDMETGKYRPASGMSGGEKFAAALSMALGLSDIIESSHALIQVESIFIDEGFGTFDDTYIDMAMKALDTLKNDNKVIAIISHVDKLKEYIPDGIIVEKDPDKGSRVRVKDNI